MLKVLLRLVLCTVLTPVCVRADDAPATRPTAPDAPLGPGDHSRTLQVKGWPRAYLAHIPKAYDPRIPSPVVLALHGAMMNGPMMVGFTGLNKTADQNNFIVVYPSGTGTGPFLTWNAGGFRGRMAEGRPDDVAFIGKVLDDLAACTSVDTKRVYACGMSNGAMMCYRLAAEMSDRIAAIAPVAGTTCLEVSHPTRPVPVIHFHGTTDPLVPFIPDPRPRQAIMRFKSVDDTIADWVKLDACRQAPVTDILSKPDDAMKVTRKTYASGKDGAEVQLIIIEDGGHTWPGRVPPVNFLGKSDLDLPANDLIWEFFKRHPMK